METAVKIDAKNPLDIRITIEISGLKANRDAHTTMLGLTGLIDGKRLPIDLAQAIGMEVLKTHSAMTPETERSRFYDAPTAEAVRKKALKAARSISKKMGKPIREGKKVRDAVTV